MDARNRNDFKEIALIHGLVFGLVLFTFVGIFAASVISQVI